MSSKPSRKRRILLIAVALFALPALYCAVVPAPKTLDFPTPVAGNHVELSQHFWKVFHAQDTDQLLSDECRTAHRLPALERKLAGLPLQPDLPPVAAAGRRDVTRRDDGDADSLLCRLEDAILESPEDAVLATITAAAYNWRAQARVIPDQMIEDLHEGRHHAKRGVELGSPLAGGFQAAPTWLLGFITEDEEYRTVAHTQFVDDTLKFPSFHAFIEAATMAGMLDPQWKHPEFDYGWAIVSMMEQLETCMFGDGAFTKIQLPEGMKLNNFMHNVIAGIVKISGRGYCYNSEAVPYNFPGMFIAQGDIYLKKGQFEYARVAYENALNSPNSENYPYRKDIHIRLNDMEGMMAKFNRESGTMDIDEHPTAMVVQSSWYCASCHQAPPVASSGSALGADASGG